MDERPDELDWFDDEEEILRGLDDPAYKRRRRTGGGGVQPGTIITTPSTLTGNDGMAVGTVIGTVAVAGGWGTYSWTFTDPTGRFALVGNQIQVASPLSAAFYNITISATNGQGDNPSLSTTIFVTHVTTYSPTYPYYGF